MNRDTVIFSFNIPTQTKIQFQNICRDRCLGMTSVLNFHIEKFIFENRDLSKRKFEPQAEDDFVAGIFPDNQERWDDYEG